MPTILVQMSDRQWTKQAMHLACSAARHTGYPLVLLHLMEVSNPGLLGSGIAAETLSWSQYSEIAEYAQIAEDYGVEVTLQPMNYTSLIDALGQAANDWKAAVCFAHISPGRWRWLYHIRVWSLQRQLEHCGCQLKTLETGQQTGESVSEIAMHPMR